MKERLTLEPSTAAVPEVARWLAAMADCRRRTLQALEGVADGDVDRRPASGGNTIGTLLYHLAAIEADWLFTEILEGAATWPENLFPFDVRDDRGRLTEVSGLSISQHLDRLEQVRAMVLDELGEMPSDEFHRPRSLPDYDVAPDWVLHHLMQHEAEHRAQISELRAAGA